MSSMDLSRYREAINRTDAMRLNGRVTQVVGLVVESIGPAVRIGEICHIITSRHHPPILAEVVGFRGNRVLLMPLTALGEEHRASAQQPSRPGEPGLGRQPSLGIAHGSEVIATGRPLTVPVGPSLLGRVLDPLGRPLDAHTGAGSLITADHQQPTLGSPPHPLRRQRIRQPLPLGVRAIDAFLTCGKGQRLGIFSGSGVGKSTLLGMIARNATAGEHPSADVSVIGLVGERGREVREFIETSLGPNGMQRSVVVVATSDQPAIQRLKAAFVATAIAEYFRDQGLHVLLTMDSLTRIAWAQREIGLAIGEPPTTRGYTPSVFALLPRLLERSGAAEHGSITGLYTILVEGDDLNEPVADTVRGILDGHIILSRHLADRAHYPAIDILPSVSRLMPHITSPDHQAAASSLRRLTATFRSAEDLINIGAYTDGTSPDIDRAKALIPDIRSFLAQPPHENSPWRLTISRLQQLAERASGGPGSEPVRASPGRRVARSAHGGPLARPLGGRHPGPEGLGTSRPAPAGLGTSPGRPSP